MSAPFDPRLLDAIERLLVRDWAGIAWRVTVGDTPVLSTNTYGGRWNSRGVEALYCSLDRAAATAEVEYLLSRQPIAVTAARKTSRIKVRLDQVVDLSTEAAADSLGYTTPEFFADDVAVPQLIGAATEWLGVAGLLVPSARYSATNLVIFTTNLTASDSVEVDTSD